MLETRNLQRNSASLCYQVTPQWRVTPDERSALARDRATVYIYGDAQVGIRVRTENTSCLDAALPTGLPYHRVSEELIQPTPVARGHTTEWLMHYNGLQL